MPLPTAEQILAATSLASFADDNYDVEDLYYKLAKRYHPDRYTDPTRKAFAERIFKHVNSIRDAKAKPAASNKLKTKKHQYTILSSTKARMDTMLVNEATYDDGHELAYIYAAKSNEASDMDNFANTLKKLNSDVPEKYSAFFPKLIEKFDFIESGGKRRTIVVTDRYEGFVPLFRVTQKHTGGISGRNVAWIFRRMLVALGNAHDVGIAHGSPDSTSFLINAEQHGLISTDWRFSTEIKEDSDWKSDLAIASNVAKMMLAPNEPKALTIFFKGCTFGSVPKASELLAEFDELLLRVYGKPKFSILEM